MLFCLKRSIYLIVFISLAGCISEVQPDNVSIIHTGPGPEDLVHDQYEGRNRIIISCNDRAEDGTYGEIEVFDVESTDTSSSILPRTNFPAGLAFNPHGIDIIEREGSVYLYVTNHYEDEADISSVILFLVEEDQIVFVKEFKDDLIATPNGITAHSNGGFYVTNDGASTPEALQEFLFNNYNGSVVYCTFDEDCSEVANGLSYPNGVLKEGEDLYVATSAHKALFEYDVLAADNLADRTKLSHGIGLDNIRLHEDQLIIAQHIDIVAFLLHSTNPAIQSPFKILAVNRTTGDANQLFYSSGDLMSGASTGLIVGDDLYIGQVFQPYLLKVEDIDL